MGMKANTDIFVYISIKNINHSFKIFRVHGTKCVHHRDCLGFKFIYRLRKVMEIFIAVSHGIGGLKIYLISLFSDLSSDSYAFSVFSMRKNHPYGIYRFSVILRQIIRIISVPIDHDNVRDITLFINKIRLQIRRHMKICRPFFMFIIFKPAALYDLSMGILHFFNYSFNCRNTEFRFCDICAIT